MSKLNPQFLFNIGLIVTVGLVAGATLLPDTDDHAHTKLNCDDPPMDVSKWT